MADLEERLRAEVAAMRDKGWGAAVVGSPTLERDQAANVAYLAVAALSAQTQTISDLTEVARIAGLVESQVGSTLQFIQDTAPGTNLKSDLLLIEALRAALSSAR